MKQSEHKRGGMTCEMAQRAIALAAMTAADQEPVAHTDPAHAGEAEPGFGMDFEAPADAFRMPDNPALAAHLRECHDCHAELAATTAFFRALASETSPEPSATLLARARVKLDQELDQCDRAGFWTRLHQQITFTGGRLRAAPALSSALLILGVIAGGYGGFRIGSRVHAQEQATLLLAPPPPDVPSVVADVSDVSRDPDTGLVRIRYDRLVPDVLTASQNDPSIRELLMAAAENGVDPRVRNASVNLLAGVSCREGEACDGSAPVRNALLNAVRDDKTPEVRREALAGLQPYIADDMDVRDAVLGVLLNDPSSSVRIEAVRLLQPVDVDSSVRQVLHAVAASDGDPSIRTASLEALRASPTVQ